MIVFSGAFGEGNFGDDLLMLACHELATPISVQSGIRSTFVGRKPIEYLDNILPPSSLKSTIEECQITTLGGGTQFFGFPRPIGQRLIRSIKDRLLPKKKSPNPFANLPTRTTALGIGIGPFIKNRSAERYAETKLRQMEFIGVRDKVSFDWCQARNIPNVVLGSDLCFLPSIRNRAGALSENTEQRTRETANSIGVIIRDWPYQTNASFHKPLREIVKRFRNQGFTVTYISFCAHSDRQWLDTLDADGENVIGWSPASQSIDSFLAQLSSFSQFITARFHGAIFAALLGRPSLCIEIEPKLKRVTEMLGPAIRLWPKPFSVSKGIEQIEQTISQFSGHQASLSQSIDRQSQATQKMVEAYQQFLAQSIA